ncbi:uncharacterized protein LOC123924978 [Meles meles]|uniref:uncharacterized protein LOC123924978 n=1 Tax=Meles meles TaxID=9662 RepID=UPI001E69CAD1|nr:uncharacterized protein LOC123924978 [Meles meles]
MGSTVLRGPELMVRLGLRSDEQASRSGAAGRDIGPFRLRWGHWHKPRQAPGAFDGTVGGRRVRRVPVRSSDAAIAAANAPPSHVGEGHVPAPPSCVRADAREQVSGLRGLSGAGTEGRPGRARGGERPAGACEGSVLCVHSRPLALTGLLGVLLCSGLGGFSSAASGAPLAPGVLELSAPRLDGKGDPAGTFVFYPDSVKGDQGCQTGF